MKQEQFEQRLFRIFEEAGYSPIQILTVTPEEMVDIPGITVPNIRAVLCVQDLRGIRYQIVVLQTPDKCQ